MKNTVTLVGFVGNTPEVRNTKGNAPVTIVSLATTRSFKDSGGKRQSETEPPRDCRRPFGLSYAAMAVSSSMA